jgi:hypothetical protein
MRTQEPDTAIDFIGGTYAMNGAKGLRLGDPPGVAPRCAEQQDNRIPHKDIDL